MNTTNTRLQTTARAALLASLTGFGLALSTTCANAADETPAYAPAAILVQYGDLNLAKAEGVKHLYDRIVAAVKEVCNSRDRSLQIAAHDKICMQQSIARAVKAANSPELTAYYDATKGPPPAPVAKVTTR
jgi:UrcA family protein